MSESQINEAVFDNRSAVNEWMARSPAAVAQERAQQNFQQGLDIVGANRDMFAGRGQPGDPGTQALINQEVECNASAANRAQNVARQQAASSGLGRGGGLDTTQRLIDEDFNRRGIASMRDIRSGLLGEGRAGTARANEIASGLFINQGFELPESGTGQSSLGAFPNFDFAVSPTKTSVPTQAPPAGTPFRGITRLPTTTQQPQQFGAPSGQRTFTARRF